ETRNSKQTRGSKFETSGRGGPWAGTPTRRPDPTEDSRALHRSGGGGGAGACQHSLLRVLSQRTEKLLCDSGPARPPVRGRGSGTGTPLKAGLCQWHRGDNGETAVRGAQRRGGRMSRLCRAIDEAYALVKHQTA